MRAFVGGFDAATARRLVDELGVEVANTYGLTEITANIATGDFRDSQDLRIERIGRPHPARRPGSSMSPGSRSPPAGGRDPGHRLVPDEGLLRPGARPAAVHPRRLGPDRRLGSIDEAGYLSFLGRTKDVIRSGGENVAAFEIERYLESHPSVLQAAVVPAPHPRLGEVPFAFVRLRPGPELTGEELRTSAADSWRRSRSRATSRSSIAFARRIEKVSKAALRERAAAYGEREAGPGI